MHSKNVPRKWNVPYASPLGLKYFSFSFCCVILIRRGYECATTTMNVHKRVDGYSAKNSYMFDGAVYVLESVCIRCYWKDRNTPHKMEPRARACIGRRLAACVCVCVVRSLVIIGCTSFDMRRKRAVHIAR